MKDLSMIGCNGGLVICGWANWQVKSTDFPGYYPEYDDAWDEKKFKENFRIQIVCKFYIFTFIVHCRISEFRLFNFRIQIIRIKKETKRHAGLGQDLDEVDDIEFDMVGVDCSIANAIRRILIAEVPSMAIEKVHIYNNTSIIHDEVLAHRLGLVPLNADARLFEYKPAESEAEGMEQDTIEFHLKVQCTKNDNAVRSTDPDELYLNRNVTTKYLEWVPKGSQEEVKPVHDNILLAKLKPGQELDMSLFCVKGIGKDHAKFSPVATATYRLLPVITLLRPVVGEAAHRLKKCFSPGVIQLRRTETGEEEAVVVDARKDTISREVFRQNDLKEAVKLERIRDHFIFSVETVGALRPEELVVEAIQVLQEKCQALLEELEADTEQTAPS
ncbi:hypothetical protein ACOMHN_008345 [Nucella lapillus]